MKRFMLNNIELPDGYNIYYYESLDSTNDQALVLGKENNIHDGSIVVAGEQRKGRGRNGRRWFSPVGNLYFSLLIKSSVDSSLPQFSFIMALSVGRSLEQMFGEMSDKIEYKWPNDVLINGKKIAGILLESYNTMKFLIIGVGVNILTSPDYATSFSNYLKDIKIESLDLLVLIIRNFDYLRRDWIKNGFMNIRKLWLEKAFKLNELIVIKLYDEIHIGKFIDIDLDGNLVIEERRSKNLLTFNSGEVLMNNI